MILEQPRQPFARAGRIAGQHGFASVALDRLEVLDHRLIDVRAIRALGAEIARAIDAEIEHRRALRLVEGGDAVRGRGVEPVGQIGRGQIQRVGGEWPVTAGIARLRLDAVAVIISDRLEPRLGRRDRA